MVHYSVFIGLVFLGCCSNVVFLELLTKTFPNSGHLITLTQFLFISIKGFIQETKFGTKAPAIPIRKYMSLVILFFVTSVLNNYALGFNISMPLHMIFRSGALIANMILGVIILKKKYNLREYLSILMITIGIFICTYFSADQIGKKHDNTTLPTDNETDLSEHFWWVVGIVILTVSLLLSSSMGIIQETLYKSHGKYPNEALFYLHFLTLPCFVFIYKDIFDHIELFNVSEPLSLIYFTIPIMWFYLILNTLTQYVCISSVFVLTTECTSLTVTLVTTLRKFVSLIISIVYFGNKFTYWHWIGTFLVFFGTFLFTNTWYHIKKAMKSKQRID